MELKYNPDGATIWERTSPNGLLESLILDERDNIYVSGGANEYVTIKYDRDGNTIWARGYKGLTNNCGTATDMDMDVFDSVVVTGLVYDDQLRSNISSIKYTADGQKVWSKDYYVQDKFSQGSLIKATDDKFVYVAGTICPEDMEQSLNCDYITMKYNNEGKQIWNAFYESGNGCYNGSGDDTEDNGSDNDTNTLPTDDDDNKKNENKACGC